MIEISWRIIYLLYIFQIFASHFCITNFQWHIPSKIRFFLFDSQLQLMYHVLAAKSKQIVMVSLIAKIVFMSKFCRSPAEMNSKDLEDIKKVRRFSMKFRSSRRLNKICQGNAKDIQYTPPSFKKKLFTCYGLIKRCLRLFAVSNNWKQNYLVHHYRD